MSRLTKCVIFGLFMHFSTSVSAQEESDYFYRDLRSFIQSMDGLTGELQRLMNLGKPYQKDLETFLAGRSAIIEEYKNSLETYAKRNIRRANGVLELINGFGADYDWNFMQGGSSAQALLDRQLRVVEQLAGLYVVENPKEIITLTRWVPDADGDFTLARLEISDSKGDVRKVLWSGKNQQQPTVVQTKSSFDMKEPLVLASLRRSAMGNGCSSLNAARQR